MDGGTTQERRVPIGTAKILVCQRRLNQICIQQKRGRLPHMNREAYEELYREAWIAQNKKDREDNPKLSPNVMYRDPKQAQENAKKGGRPKALSDKAKMINRMLEKEMTLREIADILGVTHQAVMQVKHRYGLPRNEKIRTNK